MVDSRDCGWQQEQDGCRAGDNLQFERDSFRTPFQWNDYYNAGLFEFLILIFKINERKIVFVQPIRVKFR